MKAIEFKGVTKEFKLGSGAKGRVSYLFGSRKGTVKKAVDDVSFVIHKGERVALIGKNGSGKTTIMKMIQGTCFPTEGKVKIKGTPSFTLEHTVGFDGDFTGRENIYIRGKLMGYTQEEIAEHEAAIVEYAELGEYIDQPARIYSGSMKVRLGFAIEVNLKTDIILADESVSVGEGDFRIKANKTLTDLINDEETTFVFATHSSAGAGKYCTRGIVINEGRIFFDGDVAEAVKYYKDNFSEEKPKKKKNTSKGKSKAKSVTAGNEGAGDFVKKEKDSDFPEKIQELTEGSI